MNSAFLNLKWQINFEEEEINKLLSVTKNNDRVIEMNEATNSCFIFLLIGSYFSLNMFIRAFRIGQYLNRRAIIWPIFVGHFWKTSSSEFVRKWKSHSFHTEHTVPFSLFLYIYSTKRIQNLVIKQAYHSNSV